MAQALVGAIRPEGDTHDIAFALARLADGQPECIDRAIGRIIREEHGRPTAVTEAATASLRWARSLLEKIDGATAPGRRREGRG